MGVLDDYMVSPDVSFLDKTRIQAQVLVPVVRALHEELGRDKAHALVRRALRDWSRDVFTAIGASIEGSKRRKWATVQITYNTVRFLANFRYLQACSCIRVAPSFR